MINTLCCVTLVQICFLTWSTKEGRWKKINQTNISKRNERKRNAGKTSKWEKETQRVNTVVFYCCEMSWDDCRCWKKQQLQRCSSHFGPIGPVWEFLGSIPSEKKKKKSCSTEQSRLVTYTSKPKGRREHKVWPADGGCGKEDWRLLSQGERERCDAICRLTGQTVCGILTKKWVSEISLQLFFSTAS